MQKFSVSLKIFFLRLKILGFERFWLKKKKREKTKLLSFLAPGGSSSDSEGDIMTVESFILKSRGNRSPFPNQYPWERKGTGKSGIAGSSVRPFSSNVLGTGQHSSWNSGIKVYGCQAGKKQLEPLQHRTHGRRFQDVPEETGLWQEQLEWFLSLLPPLLGRVCP